MNKYDYSFKALGTVCIITIITQKNPDIIVNKLYNFILNFEKEFSRFKEDSDLSILNKQKSLEVSSEFVGLLLACKEIYEITQGYFNPLTDIRTFGYTHSFDENNFEILDIKEDLSFDNIKIFGNTIELNENMNIDFGAIGKGYLADKVKSLLLSNGFTDFIVNLGGDITLSGKNKEGNKRTLGIMNPFEEGNIAAISLTDSSVSTSGSYLRMWKIGDKVYHHIKSPKGEMIEKQIVSLTVVDKMGYKTDGLATGLMAMGLEKALKICEEKDIDVLFILNDKSIVFTKDFEKKYDLVK